jgi:hypothetical protein
MTANVFVGLPVTSHNNSALCTATFTNVTVTGTSSALASVSQPENSQRALTLFPNPLQSDILTVESTLLSASSVHIRVIDLRGQIVQEADLGMQQAGTIKFDLELAGLSKGNYIVKVISGSGDKSAFFIKK